MADALRIDVSKYAEMKAAKSARIFKVDGVPHYAFRTYSPVDGKVQPTAVPLDRDQVVASIAQAQAQLDALTLVLADLDAAQEI